MTKQQYKICKIIRKYKYESKILKRLNSDDFQDISDVEIELLPFHLEIDYYTDPDNSVVQLTTPLIEELEKREIENMRANLPIAISICSLIISIVALIINVL